MLIAEYDYDVDIAVQREEEREIALQEGISEGAYQKALETAKLMRTHSYPIAEICTMTGLSAEEVENLSEWVGMNMLIAEYDYDVDIAVQREEALQEGEAKGFSEGISEGSYQAKLETARILKQLGDSAQKIMQATGLTEAEIEQL